MKIAIDKKHLFMDAYYYYLPPLLFFYFLFFLFFWLVDRLNAVRFYVHSLACFSLFGFLPLIEFGFKYSFVLFCFSFGLLNSGLKIAGFKEK